MASSSSSPSGWQDTSRARRPSNGGPNSGSAKPQTRPIPTPRRVVLNSPYSNMPANPMALPEDIRPPVEEDTESSNSTDDFWEQDEDLRQIIEGQLKEKSTDAPVPMPQPVTGKDPLKLDFPAAEVDSPWEEWQTVSETPINTGHATPFAPIGAPVSKPGFPEPSSSMPEPQKVSQIAMPVAPPRFPSAQSQNTPGYFSMPSRRFTEDDDLDSPSQRIPGRYPLYPKPKLPIQEDDDTPPALANPPPPIPLVSTPSIYPPVQSSVGVQADLLPETTPAPLFPHPHAASSPPVPSIYSESSSIVPDAEASGTLASTWTPPVVSNANETIWGKPTAPLKLGHKITPVQQPQTMPTAHQKPETPAITTSLVAASRPTGNPSNAVPQSFSHIDTPNLPTANSSSSHSPNKPLAQAAKPPHVATQKPPASLASSSYSRPDKPALQTGNPQGTTSNIGSAPTKPASSIHPSSSIGNVAPTPPPPKPPVKPAADIKPEPVPSKPPAAASLKPERPDPDARPSHISSSSQHTRYVNMLLALDDIPHWFNLLASFFTWILLAGFLLFPGTFTNLQQAANETTSDFQRRILTAVTNIPLFIVAWLCCGLGAAGMLWLWWRWNANYIWVTSKIFLPGFLNSLAGIITTLVNVYGVQDGHMSTTAKVTIIVVSSTAGVCGGLLIFYQLWLLRRVKAEHDRQMGEQAAGKHGEGVLKSLMKSKNSEKNSERKDV